MTTHIKALSDLLIPGETQPPQEWQLRGVQSDQCLSYVAWNTRTQEALVLDAKDEDMAAYRTIANELKGYRWLGVIDSHTHADHISTAALLAEELHAPLIMHASSPSARVQIRISKDVDLPSQAGALQILTTPGHTGDSISVIWGPFLFGGDTLLFGDTGRDDLPGGNAASHYESIQKIKKAARAEMIVLPGHDHKGGRASSWAKQLEVNPSLQQGREAFIKEAEAFDAPAPALLKKSLKENFK